MIDTNDSEFLSRIESADLKAKICDAKTAAAMIQAGDILGISGFTPCGYPKIRIFLTLCITAYCAINIYDYSDRPKMEQLKTGTFGLC